MIYPEDDPTLLNPNRLEGHEGYMLKLLNSLDGYIGLENDQTRPRYDNKRKVVPCSSVVMILEVWHNSVADYGWLDVLYEGERLRIFIQPSQWIRFFIPWPHGAFIQVN